jgi:starch phosphorylase
MEINHRFLEQVRAKWPGDVSRIQAMSIIEETTPKMVRMAGAYTRSHSR